MSEIANPHEEKIKKLQARGEQEKRELSACYLRVFSDDDGRRVLRDLRNKFGVHRMAFKPGHQGQYDPIAAAIIDGQRHVMSEIETAITDAAQK